jgi:hypothetical protein
MSNSYLPPSGSPLWHRIFVHGGPDFHRDRERIMSPPEPADPGVHAIGLRSSPPYRRAVHGISGRFRTSAERA